MVAESLPDAPAFREHFDRRRADLQIGLAGPEGALLPEGLQQGVEGLPE
jgi:hypothetical protein